jgi:hypothetical protein
MKAVTMAVILCVISNGPAAYAGAGPATRANALERVPPRASIAETGRKAVVRLVSDDPSHSILSPNYPRSFPRPSPTSHFGRQIVAGTAGAVGGLFAGAWIGAAIANAGECRGEDCFLSGMVIGAPIGAIAGAIAGVALAK